MDCDPTLLLVMLELLNLESNIRIHFLHNPTRRQAHNVNPEVIMQKIVTMLRNIRFRLWIVLGLHLIEQRGSSFPDLDLRDCTCFGYVSGF